MMIQMHCCRASCNFPLIKNHVFPPAHGAGIAIEGEAWVSGWYPAATELNILKNAYSSPTKTRKFLGIFDVFEKTRGVSKQAHAYFLYVGVPR